MRINQIFSAALFIAITSVLLCACAKKNADENECDPSKLKGTYYSIRQFARDQFDMYKGTPYGFKKVSVLNGKKDTAYENIYTLDWPMIFKTFFETDISQRKFDCLYNFSMFDDDVSETRNYYYEAKDPKLFTRKLIITTNTTTQKVVSIYIETEKKTAFSFQAQKLLYIPLKVIQIQKYEKTFFRAPQDLFLEYDFM